MVDAAAKEWRIEMKLAHIEGAWNDALLEFEPLREREASEVVMMHVPPTVIGGGGKDGDGDEKGDDGDNHDASSGGGDGAVQVVNGCEALLEMLEDDLIHLEATHASMFSASVAAKPAAGPKETVGVVAQKRGGGGRSDGKREDAWGDSVVDDEYGDLGDDEEGDQEEEEEAGVVDKTSTDFFRGTVESWQLKLGTVEQVLRLLVKVCSKWRSLEAIFLATDDANEVAANLPEAAKAFEEADRDIKELLAYAYAHPKAFPLCLADGRHYQLSRTWLVLESSQHALDGFLTAKMDNFPRLYFLPATTLLQVVARGSDPVFVVPTLAPVFDALATVNFAHSNIAKRQIAELQSHADNARDVKLAAAERVAGKEADDREERQLSGDASLSADDPWPARDALKEMQKAIALEGPHAKPGAKVAFDAASGMVAKDGEVVPFAAIFLFNTSTRPLERWLNALVSGTQDALRNVFEATMGGVAKWEGEVPREKWCLDAAGSCPSAQAVLLASKVQTTSETETALDALENGEKKKTEQKTSAKIQSTLYGWFEMFLFTPKLTCCYS